MSECQSWLLRKGKWCVLQIRQCLFGSPGAGVALAVLAFVVALSGCMGGKAHPGHALAIGGSPDRGQQVIEHYQCGQCHTIPGIRHANGVFGPPLIDMGERTMIAGNFPNVPQNMVHWIEDPKSMKPKTAMPVLGLSDQQARDVAAYLETLR